MRLRQNVKKGVPTALLLDRLLQRPERLLVTVLLFTNAAEIAGLILLTHLFVRFYGTAGFAISLCVALPIYLFLLGVLPKAIFRRFPFRALARLAGVLDFLSTLLSPLLNLGAGVGRLVLPNADKGRIFAAREELKLITAQSEQEGALTSTERAMIHNVFDFRGVTVRDVMVPMEKILAVKPTDSIDHVIEVSVSTGVDRLPVVEDGEPQGLINVLDLLLDRTNGASLGRYMRRIVTARDSEPAYLIVQRLRAARLGLAAVLDAQRRFCGIVTIEDLIRRLVSTASAA